MHVFTVFQTQKSVFLSKNPLKTPISATTKNQSLFQRFSAHSGFSAYTDFCPHFFIYAYMYTPIIILFIFHSYIINKIKSVYGVTVIDRARKILLSIADLLKPIFRKFFENETDFQEQESSQKQHTSDGYNQHLHASIAPISFHFQSIFSTATDRFSRLHEIFLLLYYICKQYRKSRFLRRFTDCKVVVLLHLRKNPRFFLKNALLFKEKRVQ